MQPHNNFNLVTQTQDRKKIRVDPLSNFFSTVCIAFLMPLLCISVQNFSEILKSGTKSRIDFIRSVKNLKLLEADLTNLPNGYYFISAGRPRGLCDLKIDGKIVSTTKSIKHGQRSSLGLGAEFYISDSEEPKKAIIICESEQGFAPGFTHTPFIADHSNAWLVQLLREFETLFMGPMFSFLLIFSLLISRGDNKHLVKLPYILFGVTAFAYSLSLAHAPRLIFSGLVSSTIHWVLRTLFGFSFYILCAHYSRFRWSIAYMYLIPIGVLVTVLLKDIQLFDVAYNYTYILFPVLSGIALFDLTSKNLKSRSGLYLRFTLITWTVVQCLDLVAIFTEYGAYTAPAVVVLMTLLVILIRRREEERLQKIQSITESALRIIESAESPEDKLKGLRQLLHSIDHRPRVSGYIDGCVIGLHDRPNERMYRFDEAGYRKTTSQDKIIDFREARGLVMKRALDTGKVVLGKGEFDGSWYSCVPLGKYAVINLSDDCPGPAYIAVESHELLERIQPIASVISDKLSDLAARMTFALEALRFIRGDGVWTEEIGSILLDIYGFSETVESHEDPFADFVTTVYLPALCARVRRWVVREGGIPGDAVYLVCIRDLMQVEIPIKAAIYEAVTEILRFTEVEGAEMCRTQGYEPIQIKVGATVGKAKIICDASQVRTTGRNVIEAARFQKASLNGGAFIKDDLALSWPKDGSLVIMPLENEAVKLNHLKGNHIVLNRKVLVRRA